MVPVLCVWDPAAAEGMKLVVEYGEHIVSLAKGHHSKLEYGFFFFFKLRVDSFGSSAKIPT